MQFLENFFQLNFDDLFIAITETLCMVFLSTLFSSIFGVILGFILFMTNTLYKLSYLYKALSLVLNLVRSIPFIILIIVLMPITLMLVGTTIGVKGVIPVLVIGAIPFVARLIQNALDNIDNNLIIMAKSYGANLWQLIWYILLPEIKPQIIAIITTTAITLIGYGSMAGAIGGGGLGDLAIRYGYQRYDMKMMLVTVFLLILIVQLIQTFFDKLIKFIKKS